MQTFPSWSRYTPTRRKLFIVAILCITLYVMTPYLAVLLKRNKRSSMEEVDEQSKPVVAVTPMTVEEKLKLITMDKTREVIITTATKGFNAMLFNWLCSVQQFHLLDQVLIYVPSDDFAQELITKYRIPAHQIHAEEDKSLKIGEEVHYRQLDYQILMVKRTQFINRVLKMGHTILLADNDAVWLKNPLQYIHQKYVNTETDFDLIAQDDSKNIKNYHAICGGFLYMKPTHRMKLLWDKVTKQHAMFVLELKQQVPEQKLLNDYKGQVRAKVEYLPMQLYPSGYYYFDTYNDEEKSQAHIVHNNWIVGTEAKVERFKAHKMWYIDMETPSSAKTWKFTCTNL